MIKRILLASVALALACAGSALAGVNGGGAMLIHVNDTIRYSPGIDFCTSSLGVTDCSGVVTRSDGDGSVETMIWILGLFTHTHPAVLAWQFGIQHNLPTGYFTAWKPCPASAFEIPDATFPDQSGTGTAVATNPALTDSVMTLYWMAPFRGPDPGTTYFISTIDYPEGDHHAEFADNSTPPIVDFVTHFGTMRWGADGDKSCPTPPPVGACCLNWETVVCRVELETVCNADGGTYLGDNTICDPTNTCSACCYTFVGTDQRRCAFVSQTYCLTHYSLDGSGGVYSDPAWAGVNQQGNGFFCSSTADSSTVKWWCTTDPHTPTKNTSWGQLKSLFR